MPLPAPPIRFSRAMLDGHGWLGLIFGALIYLVCFSGTISVLVDPLTDWERPDVPVVMHASPARLMQAAAAAHAASPDATGIGIGAPSADAPHLTVRTWGGKAPAMREWTTDPTGRLVAATEPRFITFVEDLHFDLTLPPPYGRYVVGIVGTLLLAILVTGILAHRRIIKDAFRLRRGGARRLAAADLHNRLGLWALPFHLMIALTGALLGMAGMILIGVGMGAYRGDQTAATIALQGPAPVADPRPAPIADIRPMLATVARQRPGATPTYLMWSDAGTRGQRVAMYVATDRRLTRSEQWLFAGDGRLIERDGTVDGGLGWRLYGWVSPLHYATYGGLVLKLAYVLFGMALTAIVATGGTIWLARRRDQGRPAPVLERLWAALVWGQPVALALVALAALADATWVPSLALYWGATLVMLVAARVWRDGDATARRLRHAGAALLVAVALLHLATRGTPGPLPVAIDLALLALAFWLVPAIRLPRLGAMPSRSLLHP